MRIKPTKYALLLPLVAIMVCLYSYGHYTGSFEAHTEPPAVVAPSVPNVYDLWRLTNQERVKNGLEPLVLNEKLSEVSQARCNDMVKQNYYSHVNPQGVRYDKFILDAIPTSKWNGENIAAGNYSSSSVNQAWMASPEHRDNILFNTFTDIGIATCHSDNQAVFGYGTIVVEDFIKSR